MHIHLKIYHVRARSAACELYTYIFMKLADLKVRPGAAGLTPSRARYIHILLYIYAFAFTDSHTKK